VSSQELPPSSPNQYNDLPSPLFAASPHADYLPAPPSEVAIDPVQLEEEEREQWKKQIEALKGTFHSLHSNLTLHS
jgi:hypothetical protein